MNTLTHQSSHIWRFMTLLVAAVIMVMPLSCRNSRPQDRKPQAIDSPYNVKAAMEVYGRNPQRAMLIVDSAEIVGNMSHFRAQFLRAKILSQSMVSQDLDSAYHIALTLADCDSVKKNLNDRYDVMELLSTISRLRDDDENEQKWLNELAQVCREQGDEISALRTDAEVGVIMTHLGESEAGIKKLDDAIKKLDAQKTFNGIDACVIAMKRKIGLDFDGNLAEVISLSQRIIEKMDYYESHSAECSDGSYREPHADAASDYCNFYRTQAHGYLATAHALLDNKAEARKFLAIYEQSDYAQTLNGKIAVVEAWSELGDNDKVLSLYRSLEECHTTDTITRDFIKVLRSSAIAQAAMGNTDEGKILWKRYSRLVQKYNDKLLSCKAHNYAARYHSDEQQLKIEKNETDIKYMRLSIIASILAFLLTLAFAIYFFRERSMMSLKNKALTSQISEANKYKIKYAQLKNMVSKTGDEELVEAAHETADPVIGDDVDDTEAFRIMSSAIIDRCLYLDPNFGRLNLMDLFKVSKEVVGSAFAKGSDYDSLTSFVNACRLSHAVKLLDEHREMSIKEVALASGYNSANTFGRNFKAKYSISPSEYRSNKS